MLGRTLSAAFAGEAANQEMTSLLKPAEEERAICWGRAIRLAQRLSAGTEPVLRRASIASSAPVGGKAHSSAIRTRPHQAQRGTISPRSTSVQISEKRPELFSDSQVETTAA